MNEAGEAIGFGDGGEAMAEAMAEAFGEAFGNAGEAMGEAGEAVGEAGEAVGEAAPAQARPSSAGPATPTRSPSEEEAAVRTPVVHSNSKATGASESQTATLASSPPSSASERASPDVLSIDARADGAAVAAVEEPPSKKPSDDVTKASSCDEGGGVRVGEGDDESPEAWAAEMGAVADGLDAAALVERGHHANQEGRYAEARGCFTRAFELDGKHSSLLSAANMALKLGDHDEALREYEALLLRADLPAAWRKLVAHKMQEGVARRSVRKIEAAAEDAERAEGERVAERRRREAEAGLRDALPRLFAPLDPPRLRAAVQAAKAIGAAPAEVAAAEAKLKQAADAATQALLQAMRPALFGPVRSAPLDAAINAAVRAGVHEGHVDGARTALAEVVEREEADARRRAEAKARADDERRRRLGEVARRRAEEEARREALELSRRVERARVRAEAEAREAAQREARQAAERAAEEAMVASVASEVARAVVEAAVVMNARELAALRVQSCARGKRGRLLAAEAEAEAAREAAASEAAAREAAAREVAWEAVEAAVEMAVVLVSREVAALCLQSSARAMQSERVAVAVAREAAAREAVAREAAAKQEAVAKEAAAAREAAAREEAAARAAAAAKEAAAKEAAAKQAAARQAVARQAAAREAAKQAATAREEAGREAAAKEVALVGEALMAAALARDDAARVPEPEPVTAAPPPPPPPVAAPPPPPIAGAPPAPPIAGGPLPPPPPIRSAPPPPPPPPIGRTQPPPPLAIRGGLVPPLPGASPARRATEGTLLSLATDGASSAKDGGAVLTKYRKLFDGARASDVRLVGALLADGMDVNLSGPRGATPLHIAARFGQLPMVELLLEHGADREARDEHGSTPADKARSVGKTSIALRLEQPPIDKATPTRAKVVGQVDAEEGVTMQGAAVGAQLEASASKQAEERRISDSQRLGARRSSTWGRLFASRLLLLGLVSLVLALAAARMQPAIVVGHVVGLGASSRDVAEREAPQWRPAWAAWRPLEAVAALRRGQRARRDAASQRLKRQQRRHKDGAGEDGRGADRYSYVWPWRRTVRIRIVR
mmetsp:Transcript_25410/g.66998  ORF Transcript_25410/g.66998 Transcript_25410/m.66998 type:complete len:1074 (+) Transcript_25410:873-4094(+)